MSGPFGGTAAVKAGAIGKHQQLQRD